jgi:hypothetical protein
MCNVGAIAHARNLRPFTFGAVFANASFPGFGACDRNGGCKQSARQRRPKAPAATNRATCRNRHRIPAYNPPLGAPPSERISL